VVEETAPTNKHSPNADEVGEFEDESVRSADGRPGSCPVIEGGADGTRAAARSGHGRKRLVTSATFVSRLARDRHHASSYHRLTALQSVSITPTDYWTARLARES